MNQDKRYKILFIEDDAVDRMALEHFAKENDSLCISTFARSVADAKRALESGKFDVVVTDYHLGDGDAFDVIPLVKDAPIIFTTGSGNEDVAMRALKAGAYDYLLKDQDRNYLKILMLTVVRSMTRRRAERQARMLSEAVKGISDAVFITDPEGSMVFVNEAFCAAYGWTAQEALRERAGVLWAEGAEGAGEGPWKGETVHRRKGGESFPVDYARSIIPDEAGRTGVTVHVARDITAQKKAVAEREKLIRELQDALSQVKKLSGLLPTCASCKNIRDEGGAWQKMEEYIAGRSEANFSHGICPDCTRRLYPDYAEELENMGSSAKEGAPLGSRT